MLASRVYTHLQITPEDLENGRVRLRMTAGEEWKNEMGLIHGGAMALLIDGATGRAAARTLAPGEVCATTHFSIQFLSAPEPGILVAEAWVVKRGKRVAFVEGECRSEAGALLSRGAATIAIRAR